MSSLHGVGATLEIVNKWSEFLINVWLHRLYPCDSLSDSLSVSSEDSAITSGVYTRGHGGFAPKWLHSSRPYK